MILATWPAFKATHTNASSVMSASGGGGVGGGGGGGSGNRRGGEGGSRWSSSTDDRRRPPPPPPSSSHQRHHHCASSGGPAVDDDDDQLAMAALLGEASARSEEERAAGRGGGGAGRGGGGGGGRRDGRGGGGGREGRGRGRIGGGGGDVQPRPGHYGRSEDHRDDKRIVRDDVNNDDHRRDDTDGNKRRRRWGDRDGEGTSAPSSSSSSGAADDNGATTIAETKEENPNKVKANFALSGALASDVQTGNSRQGVTLKFSEPPEARVPNTRWRLYVFRKKDASTTAADDDGLLDTYHISKQSSYLFGRERKVADVPVDHLSLSKQHAVLQYRALPSGEEERGGISGRPAKLLCRPYLMDLESTNGTFVNGVRLDPARYYELRRGDVITFGASTREYVLLTEQSTKTGI